MDIVKASHLKVIVPAELAAQSLVAFYSALWACATQEWIGLPPKETFLIGMGNLVLSMTSNAAIPWDFVAGFADKMMGATILGFVGTYDIQYLNQWGTHAVVASLRVNDDMQTPVVKRSEVLTDFSSPKRKGIVSHAGYTLIQRSSDGQFAPAVDPTSLPRSLEDQQVQRLSISAIAANRKRSAATKARGLEGISPRNVFLPENFKFVSLLTPMAMWAGKLESFYDLIALKVETGVYAHIPPMHNLKFTRWNCELSFFSYEAPVPWDFIQNVAIAMSEYAVKGFTPMYEMSYKAVNSVGKEIFVTVVMKVADEKPPIGGGPQPMT